MQRCNEEVSRAQASETRSLQTINQQNVTLKHLQEQNYVALQRKMSIAMKGKLPAMPTAPKPVGKEKQPIAIELCRRLQREIVPLTTKAEHMFYRLVTELQLGLDERAVMQSREAALMQLLAEHDICEKLHDKNGI